MAETRREIMRNRNKNIRLMSENGEFLSAKSDEKIQDSSLDNLNSLFYLNNVENNCYSKYSVNSDGVNRASEFCPDVDGFSNEYKGICPNNEENCRKKRCSDRYDSSESSDSGIAVSSSASSGTSDITDPGSPFSTSSDDSSTSPGKCKVGKRCKSEEKSPTWTEPKGRCRSEEKTWTKAWEGKQKSDKTDHFITPETDFKMAPNAPSASTPCDIWTSVTENNTANDTAQFNHINNNKTQSEAIDNKRLKVDAKESIAPPNINNNNVNVPSPISSESEPDVGEKKKKSCSDSSDGAKVKNRRSSHDSAKTSPKDTSADVASPKTTKNGTKASEKAAGCVAKSKTQDCSRHQGKITEYFKSQIKSLVGNKREFGQKKDGGGVVASKGKPEKPDKSESEPPAKKVKTAVEEKAKCDSPVFVKPSPKPPQTATLSAEAKRLLSLPKLPKGADFLKGKPEPKTLFNKILENHKNRKLAESSYLRSRSVLRPKPTFASMTALFFSTPSTSNATASTSKSSQKPSETSTRNTNVTETAVNGQVEGQSSNLEEKVQNKDLNSLDIIVSNLSEVKSSDVISSGPEGAAESDSSKSPILTVPKTIRFPAIGQTNRVDKHRKTRENICCRWSACSTQFDSASGLLEHLQNAHVLTQVSGEKFVCHWVGCKVFDHKSCSRSWLERHVLSHAGSKPYRCIVDGCGQGFSTQAILERHVNNHFTGDVKKALDNSIVHKLFRRNGKKLRYRRQPWSARMFDFFDSGIMEGLEHRLIKLTKARTGGDIAEPSGKSLALTSQVIARRVTENGRQQFLLRWFPEDIVDDEWVFENEVVKKKTVSIPSLSPSVSSSLYETAEMAIKSSSSYRTSRRKNKGIPRTSEPVAVAVSVPVEEKKPEPEPSPSTSANIDKDLISPPPKKVENSLPSPKPSATLPPPCSLLPPPPPPPPRPLLPPPPPPPARSLPPPPPARSLPPPPPPPARSLLPPPPPPPAPQKVVLNKRNLRTRRKEIDYSRLKCPIDPKSLPILTVRLVDIVKNGTYALLKKKKTPISVRKGGEPTVKASKGKMPAVPVSPTAAEKANLTEVPKKPTLTASQKKTTTTALSTEMSVVPICPPKGEETSRTEFLEEMSIVPICPQEDKEKEKEPVPVQMDGNFIDNTKLMSPMKADMVISSPYKLVASQFIEQPFVQAVMPIQMPVTYQIPVVKFAQSCEMFFPQVSNYFIPPSTPFFPTSPIQTFRNGFHFSTTGTIQIQTSSTTLQHTTSSFMQSTNTSGFQIVQTPGAAGFHQSVFTAFQNSQFSTMNIRSPTFRLLDFQPLIINQAMITSSAIVPMTPAIQPPPPPPQQPPPPPPPPPPEGTGSPTASPVKKVPNGKVNILPKPNLSQKGGLADGTKSGNQCLQACIASGTTT